MKNVQCSLKHTTQKLLGNKVFYSGVNISKRIEKMWNHNVRNRSPKMQRSDRNIEKVQDLASRQGQTVNQALYAEILTRPCETVQRYGLEFWPNNMALPQLIKCC